MDTWEERGYEQAKRPDDVRSEWDRDYSRLIHSSAFSSFPRSRVGMPTLVERMSAIWKFDHLKQEKKL